MKIKLLYIILAVFTVVVICITIIIVKAFNNIEAVRNYVHAREVSASLKKDSWALINVQKETEENIQLEGRKAIVAFATWCKPCLEKMKQYKDSVKPSDNVYFISDERLELIQEFQKKHNIIMPLYKDTSDFFERFVTMVPSVFILTNDSVMYKVEGALSYEGILDRIRRNYR